MDAARPALQGDSGARAVASQQPWCGREAELQYGMILVLQKRNARLSILVLESVAAYLPA